MISALTHLHSGSLHPEDLQQAADFILEVDALALHDLAAGELGELGPGESARLRMLLALTGPARALPTQLQNAT